MERGRTAGVSLSVYVTKLVVCERKVCLICEQKARRMCCQHRIDEAFGYQTGEGYNKVGP